jgi:4-hydroxybutyryl-CoA dehydratase / vinylacetyl-CoA-Delta-isomerase
MLYLVVYMFGRRIENVVDDPIIRPSMNAVAKTYEMAQVPEFEEIMTAKSHLSGEKINRFTHIHQSTDDLIKKTKWGGCWDRIPAAVSSAAWDGCLNALSIVTYDHGRRAGHGLQWRFLKYLTYVQENDLTCDGAMTDPKGDRGPPHKQADPDMFLHVVEETEDGIVVRGAKAHQTGAVNSHEIIVMPTIAMREEDRDYAVSFALPSDARASPISWAASPATPAKPKAGSVDVGNPVFGGHEALVVFDDVFVPWERVFMYKGIRICRVPGGKIRLLPPPELCLQGGRGGCAHRRGPDHRRIQRGAKASHIKDKIIEMNHLNETLYCGSLACAAEGRREASGTYSVNSLLANVHQAECHPVSL